MNADKIKNIIGALRNINIKDLQNVDARQIGDMLRQRVDVTLNIMLVLATIAVTAAILSGYGKRSQTLAWEINQRQERLEAVKESERLQGEYAAFLQNFPKSILTERLISNISEFAAYRHAQILSFSPVKGKSDEYVKVAGVQINVISDSYKSMVLFMKDIEDAPYALRVGQWSAKVKEQVSREGDKEVKKSFIEASMEISSIRLKDE